MDSQDRLQFECQELLDTIQKCQTQTMENSLAETGRRGSTETRKKSFGHITAMLKGGIFDQERVRVESFSMREPKWQDIKLQSAREPSSGHYSLLGHFKIYKMINQLMERMKKQQIMHSEFIDFSQLLTILCWHGYLSQPLQLQSIKIGQKLIRNLVKHPQKLKFDRLVDFLCLLQGNDTQGRQMYMDVSSLKTEKLQTNQRKILFQSLPEFQQLIQNRNRYLGREIKPKISSLKSLYEDCVKKIKKSREEQPSQALSVRRNSHGQRLFELKLHKY